MLACACGGVLETLLVVWLLISAGFTALWSRWRRHLRRGDRDEA